MKLTILVKPNARHEKVEVQPDGSLKVHVNAPPQEGRANERVVEILAKHFKIPKSRIVVVHGATGRQKVIKIS
jgi:uncharacterized protein (TIGR00251 family)